MIHIENTSKKTLEYFFILLCIYINECKYSTKNTVNYYNYTKYLFTAWEIK
jgi:hypothetical protein